MREFTLKLGDTLIIGDRVRLRPFARDINEIRFAIEAPKDVRVKREELLSEKLVRPAAKVPV